MRRRSGRLSCACRSSERGPCGPLRVRRSSLEVHGLRCSCLPGSSCLGMVGDPQASDDIHHTAPQHHGLRQMEILTTPIRRRRQTSEDLDRILAAQCIVAWAGEGGEVVSRLGWWPSQMVAEYGGGDLFERLLPRTWRWAILQTAREAARLKDLELRKQQSSNADEHLSLFHLGFEVDEQLDERLQWHKRGERAPHEVLPDVQGLINAADGTWVEDWAPADFWTWVDKHPKPEIESTPLGRRLTRPVLSDPAQLVAQLVGALSTPTKAPDYPLPHARSAR